MNKYDCTIILFTCMSAFPSSDGVSDTSVAKLDAGKYLSLQAMEDMRV